MAIMSDRNMQDPVAGIGALIAGMCLRESAFLDELWIKRNPRPFGVISKRRHRQFMRELIGYYSSVCEEFFECELPEPTGRFIDLVAHEAVRCATVDPFLARPPYFKADLVELRQKRYLERIDGARAKLKLMPSHVRAEWMAARTALELRQIICDPSDDANELSMIERILFERLQWTAGELTG
jgi:hypothetical protein